MTSKVLKANGQVIYTSTYHALTDNEMANPEEIKARQAFDAAVSNKLGAPMSKHDLPSKDIGADTLHLNPSRMMRTLHSASLKSMRSPLKWLTLMLEPK